MKKDITTTTVFHKAPTLADVQTAYWDLMEQRFIPKAIKCNYETLQRIKAAIEVTQEPTVIATLYGMEVKVDETLCDGEVEFEL